MKPKLGDASTEYVFLDVVSYSKRTIESQAAIIKTLNRIVLESARTQKLRRDRVIYIPTGDGVCIALIDISSPFDVQMKMALQILERLHKYNSRAAGELKFHVRIGINASRDNVIVDINGNPNVSGDGINMCGQDNE